VRDQISGAPGSHCLKVWNMQMYYSPLLLAKLLLNTLRCIGENEIFFFLDECGPIQVRKRGASFMLKHESSAK